MDILLFRQIQNALDYLNRQMDLANQFDLRDEEIAGLAVASRYFQLTW